LKIRKKKLQARFAAGRGILLKNALEKKNANLRLQTDPGRIVKKMEDKRIEVDLVK